jgi:hypothetical protein
MFRLWQIVPLMPPADRFDIYAYMYIYKYPAGHSTHPVTHLLLAGCWFCSRVCCAVLCCARCGAAHSESLEMLRQIVDIKAASDRNRAEAVEIGLMDAHLDSRTRSTLGQEQILAEMRALDETAPKTQADIMNSLATREVMDRFSVLFT